MSGAYIVTKGRKASVPRVSAKLRKVDKESRKLFGKQCKQRRVELDLTQMEFAKLVDQAYFTFISNVENGGTKIPAHDVIKWAKALQIPKAQFAKAYFKAVDRTLFDAVFEPNERDVSMLPLKE